MAKNITWFFSDVDDNHIENLTKRLINTHCGSSYSQKSLSCKMANEFDHFYYSKQRKKWFCHFDDDNYVNVPRLFQVLSKYSSKEYWYIGRALKFKTATLNFSYATGGAGFCLSRAIVLKMRPFVRGGKFMTISEEMNLPDDITVGHIVNNILEQNLTSLNEFHSHLEPLDLIYNLHEQISLSYNLKNKVNINRFNETCDYTRFLSIHCYLYPFVDYCQNFKEDF